MSFFINNSNPNRPGPMCGNPLNGICEKVLIETTKVFDACVCITTETGIILQVTNFNPANPALPLTFISTENTPGQPAIISNLVVERIDSSPNFANVSMTITLPVTVTFRDANGVLGTGASTVTVLKTAVLFIPQPAFTPVNITATAILSSSIGTYTDPDMFTITACIQILLKVVANVDILVPSYGYPVIPPCQPASAPNACPGLRDLPLYPTATPVR